MKIIQLQAENIKGIKAITITPEGRPVVLGGDNGAGKSSVLDAIAAVFGGKKYTPPGTLRNGTEECVIVAETEDLVVTRIITETKNQVKVEPKGTPGAAMSAPQSALGNLLGPLTFDPLEFERMDSKSQAETLRRMVGLDFTEHDAQRKALYVRRTDVNRALKQAEARLDGMPLQLDVGTANEEKSARDLIEKIQSAQEHNRQALVLSEQSQNVNLDLVRLCQKHKELLAEASHVAIQIDEKKEAVQEIQDDVASFEEIEVFPLQAQLDGIEEFNRKVRANVEREEAKVAVKGLKSESSDLTSEIDKLDGNKAEAIAAADYPVEGLEARDDGVFLAGVPISQACQSERLRACVAIGMALNPELRVLLIRDGCRLDTGGLALIQKMAEAEDCQVWIERVGRGDECTVIIEDGEVVS